MLPGLVMAALLGAFFVDEKTEPNDPKAPKAREITIKLKSAVRARGGLKEPLKITKAKELEDSPLSKEDQAALLKEVDLKKEMILVFSWAGSGGDKLSMKTEKEEAIFTMKPGLTRDLRQHLKIYALPAKMKYKMDK